MDWSVESAEDSSKEAAEERADEVGVEVVSQVSALVLHNLCLEDGQAEGDGRVEGSGVVVSDLDEATKGQGHGEGDQDAVLGGARKLSFQHQDNSDEDEGAHDLCDEGLPVLAETIGIGGHIESVLSLRVSRGENGDSVLGNSQLTVDPGAQSDSSEKHTEEGAYKL